MTNTRENIPRMGDALEWLLLSNALLNAVHFKNEKA